MKSSTVLALGGLGLAAWLLSSKRRRAGSPGADTGGFGPQTNAPPDAQITAGYVDSDFFLSVGMKADSCGLPDDRHTKWDDKQLACVSAYHKSRAEVFVANLWQPASRIPITSLTETDFQLAMLFLANRLDRRGVPLTYGQSRRIDSFNDSIGWVVPLVKYTNLIASALTFGIWGAVSKIGAQIGGSASGDEQSKNETPDQTVERLQRQNEDAVRQLVQFTNGGEIDLAIDFGPQDGQYSPSVDAPFIDGRGPSIDFGFDPLVFSWGTIVARMHLFAPDPAGAGTWKYGWVSREMGYTGDPNDKTVNPDRIARQARLYRTLDVLGALLKPARRTVLVGSPPAGADSISVSDLDVTYQPLPNTYAYRVGATELWGCVLPSAPEDHAVDLSNTRGRFLAETTSVAGIMPKTTGQIAAAGLAGDIPLSVVSPQTTLASTAGATTASNPAPLATGTISKAGLIAARTGATATRQRP